MATVGTVTGRANLMSRMVAASCLVLAVGCQRGPSRHEGASFVVSADGASIALTTGPGSGNSLRLWKRGGSIETIGAGAYFEGPGISPDGKYVVVATGRSFRSKLSLVRFDLSTKNRTPIAELKDQSQYSPSYSPDGKWIAFRSAAKPRSQSMGGVQWTDFDIYVTDAEGKDVRRLTQFKSNRMTPLRWSADSKLLTTACSDREGRTWLRGIDLEGKVVWELEGQNNESMPCFVDNRVAIVSDRENVGRYRVGWIDINSGQFSPIIKEEGYFLDPQSASGKVYVLEDVAHKMRFRVAVIDPSSGAITEVVPEREFDEVRQP